MTSPARRPWWKKKRWAAAVGVWLAMSYPVAPMPVAYLLGRGWLGSPAFDRIDRTLFAPLANVLSAIPGTLGGRPAVEWWRTVNHWCYDLGERHRAMSD